MDCDGLIIQELYDGSWRIHYSEPGREYEKTLFLSNNESEACEEFLRMIKESIRGYDMYILCDPGAYNVEYKMFGQTIPMSPDEHFANLKRIIALPT